MPDGICSSTLTTDVGCDGRTKLIGPAADGFVGHVDAALSQKIFDVAQAQRETVIEPNTEPDNVRGKAMTFE